MANLTRPQTNLLYYIMMGAFVTITIFAIWGVFFSLENLDPKYKDVLFYTLLIELVLIVLMLIRNTFGVNLNANDNLLRVSVHGIRDVKSLNDKLVGISFRDKEGNPIGKENSIPLRIVDDDLVIKPAYPPNADYVILSLKIEKRMYSHSFEPQSRKVKLTEIAQVEEEEI